MQTFLVAVVSLFGGIALCGFGVFLYFQYLAVKRLTVVGEKVFEVMQPLAQGNTMPEFLKAIRTMNATGKDIIVCLSALTPTIAVFNKMMATGQAAPATQPTAASSVNPVDKFTSEPDSIFAAPTEAEQAVAEEAAELRKHGIEVEGLGEAGEEPPLASMVGANV